MQQPLFQDYADRMMSKLRAQTEEKVDLVRMFNFTAFDIMSELAFGQSLNMLEQDDYCPWVQVIFDFIKIEARMDAIGQLLPLGRTVVRSIFGPYIGEKKAEHFRFCEERVSRRLNIGSGKADIWNVLLQGRKSEEQTDTLTQGEMGSNAFALMVAGTETVATALSGLTYLLLKNPTTMVRLASEVRNAFQSEGDITWQGLQQLPYLSACIEETLRLYPPVATGTARVVPPRGSIVCGSFIPGGVSDLSFVDSAG
jgi:cytochrome P450